MGKPFDSELHQIPETIAWTRQADIEVLERWAKQIAGESLYAVGIGGSFTAAKLAARLHEARGGFAAAKTTLDFTTGTAPIRRANVMILTGAGQNRDVLSAFDYAVAAESRSLLALCATKSSVLARRAKSHWHTTVFDFALPSRHDGFLATNSLLATCLLLARAFGNDVSLVEDKHEINLFEQQTADLVSAQRKTLLVLHSGWSTPAAVDLESKCSEAGLRAVLLSDYRHFAHGRHQWLAAHGSASAVVAFVSPEEAELADKTLGLLPTHLPKLRLETAFRGPAATVDLLLQTFHLVAGLGRASGIDPGRPGVPPMGRQIYHLRAQVNSSLLRTSAANTRTIAICRKQAANPLRPTGNNIMTPSSAKCLVHGSPLRCSTLTVPCVVRRTVFTGSARLCSHSS